MPTPLQLYALLGVETALGLTDDDGDGQPDTAVVQHAWEAAQAEVLTALEQGGAPPVLEPALMDIAHTLMAERLFLRRRAALPGPWAERADRARAILREIADRRHPITRPHGIEGGATTEPLHRIDTMRGL